MRPHYRLLTVLALGLLAQRAHADPKFEFKPVEAVKKVEWKVSAQLGLLLTTGNSNQLSFSAGGSVSRNDGKNKLALDVNGAYAKATVFGTNDTNGDGFIGPGETTHTEQVSTALWAAKLRYDRFITANNSLYLTAFANGNKPAGKNVVAGGQLGYARQLFKSDWHVISAELGFDYSFENMVADNTPNLNIASLRLFLGYGLTLSKDTNVVAEVEVLCNLNPLDLGGNRTATSFEDTRVNAKVALNTRLWKSVAFRLQFLAKYDNVPSPAQQGGVKYLPGFLPLAEKLDTITDASIVVNFL